MSRVVWRKSSRSGSNNGNCVEVAWVGDTVVLRDSKHPDNGTLVFSRSEWATFVGATKNGEFDR
jgi:hypothetical protein